MTWYVGLEYDTYEEARADFTWDIPSDYNIARDFLAKHDDPSAPALHFRDPDGDRTFSYGDLDDRSSQLANALAERGIGTGDRVGVILPQAPENPITHLACWKLGAVSVAMSILFGPDSIAYRLRDSGAKAVVADTSVVETVREAAASCPDLETVIEVGGTGEMAFAETIAGRSTEVEIAPTDADTPALVLYTSGSTGPPKGVLHGHGLWVGASPSFLMYFERDIDEAVFWTPADWAWIGALGNVTFPPMHFGRPVVGSAAGSFDPESAFALMADFGVTHAFIPPTALRMMREVDRPGHRYDLSLEVIASGSEPLTPEIVDWVDREFPAVTINEMYGQTEANVFVTTCQGWFDQQLGKVGKVVPGHEMAILDPETG
ncbi:MAG: AMP-binding protein, partial [Halobacteriales archaeon]|nr:AMP-binding protein [Halobacteriales archaeon]